ncbi:MAG: mechanosensitive ion channel family protein [Gammaproteobacteria bacterium]|nr:MAG: mechanosensitive ion channel family protein [Gammaproteobacteria bacterium]
MNTLDWPTLRNWFSELAGSENAWILQIFVIILVVVVTNFVVRVFLNRLHRKLSGTRNEWDDALVLALKRPLPLLVWIIGLTFAADVIKVERKASIFEFADPLRDIGIIAMLAWFLVRFVEEWQRILVARHQKGETRLDRATIVAMGKLMRLTVIITAVLVALQTLGVSVAGVMAFGGIGGIAIGFAAKDLLANFFGGLMIYLDRPFIEGDWIRSPDKDIEGTVEHIGWRLTRIRRFNKRPLYVPNSVFMSIAVENPSRMLNRRIYETLGIRYDDLDKMDAITRDVKAMLRAHPEIDQEQTMIVNFNAFNESSVDFFIYTFTKTTEWVRFHEIKQDILLKVAEIIQRHGAEMAFPTRTVYLERPVPDQPDDTPEGAGAHG